MIFIIFAGTTPTKKGISTPTRRSKRLSSTSPVKSDIDDEKPSKIKGRLSSVPETIEEIKEIVEEENKIEKKSEKTEEKEDSVQKAKILSLKKPLIADDIDDELEKLNCLQNGGNKEKDKINSEETDDYLLTDETERTNVEINKDDILASQDLFSDTDSCSQQTEVEKRKEILEKYYQSPENTKLVFKEITVNLCRKNVMNTPEKEIIQINGKSPKCHNISTDSSITLHNGENEAMDGSVLSDAKNKLENNFSKDTTFKSKSGDDSQLNVSVTSNNSVEKENQLPSENLNVNKKEENKSPKKVAIALDDYSEPMEVDESINNVLNKSNVEEEKEVSINDLNISINEDMKKSDSPVDKTEQIVNNIDEDNVAKNNQNDANKTVESIKENSLNKDHVEESTAEATNQHEKTANVIKEKVLGENESVSDKNIDIPPVEEDSRNISSNEDQVQENTASSKITEISSEGNFEKDNNTDVSITNKTINHEDSAESINITEVQESDTTLLEKEIVSESTEINLNVSKQKIREKEITEIIKTNLNISKEKENEYSDSFSKHTFVTDEKQIEENVETIVGTHLNKKKSKNLNLTNEEEIDEEVENSENESNKTSSNPAKEKPSDLKKVTEEETSEEEQSDIEQVNKTSKITKKIPLNISTEENQTKADLICSTPLTQSNTRKSRSFDKLEKVKKNSPEKPSIMSQIDNLIKSSNVELNGSSEDEEAGNDFILDQAEEGEEDTPSEGSNDIVDEGESINSISSEYDGSDDEYEKDSFLTDDEAKELLEGEEYDIYDFADKKNTPKNKNIEEKNKSRIIRPTESSDEEIEIKSAEISLKKGKKSRIIRPTDSTDEEVENQSNKSFTSFGIQTEKQWSDKSISTTSTNIATVANQTKSEIKKSVAILENLKVEEIQSQEVITHISEAVEKFFTDIKEETGEVKINLSLDYSTASYKDDDEQATNSQKIDKTKQSKEDDVIVLETEQLVNDTYIKKRKKKDENLQENSMKKKKKAKHLKSQEIAIENTNAVDTTTLIKTDKKKDSRKTNKEQGLMEENNLNENQKTVMNDFVVTKEATKRQLKTDSEIIPKKKFKPSGGNSNNKNKKGKESTDIVNDESKTHSVQKFKLLPSKQPKLTEDIKVDYFPNNLLSKIIKQEEKRKKSKRPSLLLTSNIEDQSWNIEPNVLLKPSKKSARTVVEPNNKKIKKLEKQIPTASDMIRAKDFKTQRLYDPGRVRRMDTKTLIKKKLLK